MTAVADTGQRDPGIYVIDEAEYFASGYALSCSGAKLLLDCPARFAYHRDHPIYKDVFDAGSAAHKLVLGSGPPVQVVDADYFADLASEAPDAKTAKMYGDAARSGAEVADWRTNAAKAAKAAAREAGLIPVLRHVHDRTTAMADAILTHPLAAKILDPETGSAEQSLFWQDRETGVPLRARLDWIRDSAPGRLIVADYKTCDSASPDAIMRAVWNYGYYIQDAWYLAGVRALFPEDDPALLLIFQEKEPPYIVNVVQLDLQAELAGHAKARRAIEIWRTCTETGTWPAYGDDIDVVSLPPWALTRED